MPPPPRRGLWGLLLLAASRWAGAGALAVPRGCAGGGRAAFRNARATARAAFPLPQRSFEAALERGGPSRLEKNWVWGPARRWRRAVPALDSAQVAAAAVATAALALALALNRAAAAALFARGAGVAAAALSAVAAGPLFVAGARRDSLALLFSTATAIPLAKALGVSPIVAFMANGVALGPNGLGVVTQLHTTEALAELGVVFFLFEMGLELSLERLGAMKTEIFGLGLAQFVVTAAVLATAAASLGFASPAALTVVGGALALSSSAFVLQLLRDQNELSTRHGRAALGVLLLQDLAVVPLLVVVPLLAQMSSLAGASFGVAARSIGGALAIAALKAGAAIAAVEVFGKRLFDVALGRAEKSRSQEAFLAAVLGAAVGVSAMTEAIGLSTTLGAFLAGLALSETRYTYQVEATVAPFRGMLLGLFFVTVGFSIDVALVRSAPFKVLGLAFGLLGLKTAVLTTLAKLFGLPFASALRCGLLLSQGGEFAFVAFANARRLGILSAATERLLLTACAISMAATPALSGLGAAVQRRLEKRAAASAPAAAAGTSEAQLREFFGGDGVPAIVVCGYGRVGRVVCEMLDAKLERYVVVDDNADKVNAAKAEGKPVFLGDATDEATLARFGGAQAQLIVVCLSDQKVTNSAVVALRKLGVAKEKAVVRAADDAHSKRLQRVGLNSPAPQLADDSRLLSLPFGGAVLRSLGFRADDVNMLIEERRSAALDVFRSRPVVTEDVDAALLLFDADDDRGTAAPKTTAPKRDAAEKPKRDQ
ncbi:Sodium/hydrogen exchanger family-domain-containing protein [Pelagophyceae sp. CCMP2097]|nr:Sodium/hydrogen exchanger family-domain-containing protein [Pelagophyceae sp. CCMP2097]